MSDKLEQVAEDVGQLKIAVAEIATAIKLNFAQHTEQLKEQTGKLAALDAKTETALLPIRIGKALVVFVSGASVVLGGIYGAVQFVLYLGKGPTLP